MSTTPATSYATLEPPTKPASAFYEPRPFAPYDTIDEQFVYGKWEYDLMDAPRDCMVRTLPCVTIAQISARVHPGSYTKMLLTQLACYLMILVMIVMGYIVRRSYLMEDEAFNRLQIAVFVVAGVAFVLAVMWTHQLTRLRTTVRNRFQIEGSTCDDSWAVFCCLTCAAAQMARQTKSSEFGNCDMEPRDALPAYSA